MKLREPGLGALAARSCVVLSPPSWRSRVLGMAPRRLLPPEKIGSFAVLLRRCVPGRRHPLPPRRAASSEKLYLETIGAGVGWIDYDQDGFLDAFFVNSGATPHFKPPAPRSRLSTATTATARFTDVTEKAGLSVGPGLVPLRRRGRRLRQRRLPRSLRVGLSPLPPVPQHRQRTLRGRDRRGRGREPGRLGDGGGLLRLRPRRQARPARHQLRPIRHGAQRRLRRSDAQVASLLPSRQLSRDLTEALSRQRGRHLRGRHRAGEAREPRRQEPRRRPGGPGRRRLDRRLHRQRHAAELSSTSTRATAPSRTRATARGPGSAKTARPRRA